MHPAAFTWPRIQVSSTNIGQNIQIATTTSSGSKHCVWEGEESDALYTALLHTCISHAEVSWSNVLVLEVLIGKTVPIYTLAACSISSCKISTWGRGAGQ